MKSEPSEAKGRSIVLIADGTAEAVPFPNQRLESHDVIAAVHIDDFTRDAAAGVGSEEDSS